ncbi:cytochrome P450 [Allorhizocola rhizosphaerae]|uniref:cytochrome P450 n=1 Tax=Allorhizocola rhizosphaerae TaxID=1872709 RepID=UPI000E3BBBE2|nr:cytochrome P450 [Allorhizocola rhizosphaerae]
MAELPAYPLARECPYRPSPQMARLNKMGPLTRVRLYDGRIAWLVTGPAEARALLADKRVSSRSDHPNYPVMDPRHLRMRATREMAREQEGGFAGALFGVDPPEHSRQRQLLVPRFTARQVAALRPRIQQIVDEQLDALLAQGPPADLVADFAAPVPLMVICAHLGVPYTDRQTFEPAVRRLFDPERADAAMAELTAYLHRLIDQKAAGDPGPGVLDSLVAGPLRQGKLDRAMLAAFALAILVAGTITTSSVIALGTLALLDHPEQYAQLAADPDRVPGAVEEILRYVSLVEQLARVAVADVDIAGHTIKAGDPVLVSMAAANLDPSVTSNPERLDVTGPPPANHLAFSFGIHHCLGHNLARLELEVAFRTLVERVPTLRLAVPAGEVPTYRDADVQRLASLPVAW